MDAESESFEPMLKESIKLFLAAYRTGNPNFSAFQSISLRLIQSMPDPPLEVIWFYSALTFHSAKASSISPPNKLIVMAKDLFQLLVSMNDSRNGLKTIALLAPVVSVLSDVVRDSRDDELLLREAEDLLVKVVSYVQMSSLVWFMQMSSCDDGSQIRYESDFRVVCFEDLVQIWSVGRVEEGCTVEENLKVLFPVWSDGVWNGTDGRYGVGRLAGMVLCELFLVRLCLKLRLIDISGDGQQQKDLQNCAVQTISSFQNSYFLDMLLRMLVEPTFPVTNLLSSDELVTLMRVIYDTLLLVDSSFLNSGRWIQLLDNESRNFALMMSVVAGNAVQSARDSSDQFRAISYANCFCKSHLCSHLIEWLSREAGVEEDCKPYIENPNDLIRLAYVLEDNKLVVFDKSISKLISKVAEAKPHESTFSRCIFRQYSDRKKFEFNATMDEEMADPSQDANEATTITIETQGESGRKRKEEMKEEGEPKVKLARYNSGCIRA